MREREVNDVAAQATLLFLQDVEKLCESGKCKSLAWLIKKYGISNTTGIACKELNILVFEDGLYKWVPKSPPTRQHCVSILENLRSRVDKKKDVPIFDLEALGDKIGEKLNQAIANLQPAFNAPKTRMMTRALNQSPMGSNSLFGEVESKENVKRELLKAIAGGVYNFSTPFIMNGGDTASIGETNAFIIQATEDLYNQFYGVKQSLKAV